VKVSVIWLHRVHNDTKKHHPLAKCVLCDSDSVLRSILSCHVGSLSPSCCSWRSSIAS
jgi:hypothetical protein